MKSVSCMPRLSSIACPVVCVHAALRKVTRPSGPARNTVSRRLLTTVRYSSSERATFSPIRLRSVTSVRIAMYFEMRPVASTKGTMVAWTQNSSPFFARLQISPRHTRPVVIVCHSDSKNARGWMLDLTRRWVLPMSSSRV